MTAPSVSDALGLIGALFYLAAFAGLQLGRLDPREPPALLMNLAGAVLVTISLLSAFNLAAIVLQLAWGGMAVYGLVRRLAVRTGG